LTGQFTRPTLFYNLVEAGATMVRLDM
jgi:hypothetical protein